MEEIKVLHNKSDEEICWCDSRFASSATAKLDPNSTIHIYIKHPLPLEKDLINEKDLIIEKPQKES